MDSQNEEISSIFERFRGYLIDNNINLLLNEFNHYRINWSTNKFRMFLTNTLVVMRTWADSPAQLKHSTTNEDWDIEESPSTPITIADQMKTSAYYFFLSIADYLQETIRSKESNRMSTDMEFEMWKRVVTNKWTMNEKFYLHLYEENFSLPIRLIHSLHNDMYDFYMSTSQWSSLTKIRLIQLGFIHLLIHDNVFLGCNHILSAMTLFTLDDYRALTEFSQIDPMNYQTKLIISINTPSKMKIFLDYYPNIDLTELTFGNNELYQQRTPLTIFDRLIKMEVFYYETIEMNTFIDIPDFTSDQNNVRTANILYLFQKLLSRDAKLSIPLDVPFYQNHRIPFYTSTLGFYLLSIIRFRDTFVIPTIDRDDENDNEINLLSNSIISSKILSKMNPIYFDSINENYIIYLIKRASTFTSQFRSFFFNHLNLCCPFIQKISFQNQFNSIRNHRLRSLYEELIEKRSLLTLKQRCRLLIKESIKQYPLDITKLSQLPITLQYYLSFDLFNPNFVQLTFKQFNEVQGRIKPTFFDELQFHEHNDEQINGHHDWEDQIPEDMDNDDNDDDDQLDEYDDADADLFDEEDLYSDNNDDDDDW